MFVRNNTELFLRTLQVLKLTANEPMPFDLLLLADETVEAIVKYLYSSEVYVVTTLNKEILAVLVLYPLSDIEIEIKNIAVRDNLQRKGIGSYLLNYAVNTAQRSGYRQLWVGTPSIAAKEIVFFEKNGFKIAGLKKRFFIENYPEPIMEDGLLLEDMVMLKINLCDH
jgi:ribosomal protein S18 acetylase RimI-like enzyme